MSSQPPPPSQVRANDELRKLQVPLAKKGYIPKYLKKWSGLGFIDPKPGSKSRLKYEEFVAKGNRAKGIGQEEGGIVWYSAYCALAADRTRDRPCASCCSPTFTCAHADDSKYAERRLLKLMEKEQRKRNRAVRPWIPLVKTGVAQFNASIEKVANMLINSAGYQLNLTAVMGKMRRDFSEMMAMQSRLAVMTSGSVP